jgi:2'-5' RNA ligase
MLRLFIAINLPSELLQSLGDVQNRLRQHLSGLPLTWVRTEGIHLTLKFLGETDPRRVEGIVARLRTVAAAWPPFVVPVDGLGCFPDRRRPQVVWVGVQDPDGALQRLAAAVDEAMADLGWEREKRPFTGHLTLARVKRDAGNEERRRIGEHIAAFALSAPGLLPVQALHLMRSQLDPGGAVYSEVAVVPLAATTKT